MTEENAGAMLIGHGVPEALLGVWAGVDGPLRYFSWHKPDFALAEELERRVPGLRALCPLFEDNGEAVIGYLPEGGRFIRYYYEKAASGDAAIELAGSGYQQFACWIVLQAAEAGFVDLLEQLVSYLRFTRGDELLALLDAEPYDAAAVDAFNAGLAEGNA